MGISFLIIKIKPDILEDFSFPLFEGGISALVSVHPETCNFRMLGDLRPRFIGSDAHQ